MFVLQSEQTKLGQALHSIKAGSLEASSLLRQQKEVDARMRDLEGKVQRGDLTQERYGKALTAMKHKMEQLSQQGGPASQLALRWHQLLAQELIESAAEVAAPPEDEDWTPPPMPYRNIPCMSLLQAERIRLEIQIARQGGSAGGNPTLVAQRHEVETRVEDLEGKVERGELTQERYIQAITAMKHRMEQLVAQPVGGSGTALLAREWLGIIQLEIDEASIDEASGGEAAAGRPPPGKAAAAAKAVMQQNSKLVQQVVRQEPAPVPGSFTGLIGIASGDLDSEEFDAMWAELNGETDAGTSLPPRRQAAPTRPQPSARKPSGSTAAAVVDPCIAEAMASTRPAQPIREADIEAIIAAAAAEMGPGQEPASDYESQIMGQSSALDKQMEEQMAKLDGLMKF